MKTIYVVQVKCDEKYETASKTTNRSTACRRAQDLAEAGYDGRIKTAATGHVIQEWRHVN